MWSAMGRRGANLEQDANGDGVVDSRDRTLAYAASLDNSGTGHKLAAGLLDDGTIIIGHDRAGVQA